MSEKEEPLPSKIDRYEPLRRLATGGMAEIFLAKQSGLEGFEKVVVLKRILSHLASDEEFVSMFLDEARIAAKLSHPNIVQIYDLGKTDNSYYIAMEYVSGRNVQHLINKQQARGGRLPVEHVVRVIAGVCDGLFYAHSRKDYDGKPLSIIHRDISPQNILVSFQGGVKVVDFGIAKASTQLAQTRAGVLKGKYAYMSPEQVRGAKIDHRSDLFAVGLVMYEMLTGMRAFERDTSLKTLKAIVQERPLNPREMNPEIPMEVVKLLSKALEKNPDRRYKTAQEMQLALEDWLEASPKKSNNVRLSRFMYDLFDDELQSADGTMVVKGVGQVIIPTSQGQAQAKAAIEEEVDHKTLTAALVDEKPGAELKPAPRVRDEIAAKAAQAPPPPAAVAKTPKPTPTKTPPPAQAAVDEDEDNDGKTVPGYDLEQLERDRQAAMAKQGIASTKRNPVTAEDQEDEDKTRAGVPMSASAPPQPPVAAARPGRVDDSDARARAMLAKVENMAPRRAPAEAARTASLPDQEPMSADYSEEGDLDDDGLPTLATQQPAAAAMQTQNQLSAQSTALGSANASANNGRWEGSTKETQRKTQLSGDNLIIGSGGPVGGPQPTDDISGAPAWSPPTSTLPQPLMVAPEGEAEGRAPPQTTQRPTAWFAAVGASLGMSALALVLFGVGAVLSPAAPAQSFGLVAITSTPPGATVVFEGSAIVTPGQLSVQNDGVERTIEVKLGDKTKTEKVMLPAGTTVMPLNVAFDG